MVINEKNRQIVLLSIDNKLIKEHVGGICDCALFDDKQFRFVEFKTNAYGNSPEQVRETFDKATSQLKETIHVFKDRLQKVDIQFEDAVVLSCHVVVSQRFPKSRAIKQEYQISFADENDSDCQIMFLCIENLPSEEVMKILRRRKFFDAILDILIQRN